MILTAEVYGCSTSKFDKLINICAESPSVSTTLIPLILSIPNHIFTIFYIQYTDIFVDQKDELDEGEF